MNNTGLTLYIEREILPRYNGFDKAHREDHARMVIKQSLEIASRLVGQLKGAQHYAVKMEMVYAVAAFHDLGLAIDRKTHHLESGRIVREDQRLHEWFTQEEIETMAQAVEDHRASSDHEPRSIYGKIVAEGDRYIEPEKIIERTVQYGLDHYPELDKEGHWQRTLDHLHEKYAGGGYLKLWFPESPNVERLNSLREIIKDEARLRRIFDKIWLKRSYRQKPFPNLTGRERLSVTSSGHTFLDFVILRGSFAYQMHIAFHQIYNSVVVF